VESCLDAQNPGACIMLQLWKLDEVLPDLEEQMPHISDLGKSWENPPWCHGWNMGIPILWLNLRITQHIKGSKTLHTPVFDVLSSADSREIFFCTSSLWSA